MDVVVERAGSRGKSSRCVDRDQKVQTSGKAEAEKLNSQKRSKNNDIIHFDPDFAQTGPAFASGQSHQLGRHTHPRLASTDREQCM